MENNGFFHKRRSEKHVVVLLSVLLVNTDHVTFLLQ